MGYGLEFRPQHLTINMQAQGQHMTSRNARHKLAKNNMYIVFDYPKNAFSYQLYFTPTTL